MATEDEGWFVWRILRPNHSRPCCFMFSGRNPSHFRSDSAAASHFLTLLTGV